MNDIAVTERNTPAAVARLAELEAIIAAGKPTFYEVGARPAQDQGRAALQVQERGVFTTFEAHCKSINLAHHIGIEGVAS